MPQTLTERLGIALPITLAPMAGEASKAPFVAAVSNAGGLGVLGGGYLAPAALRAMIRDIRALTDKPFGVNLFIYDNPTSTDAAALAHYTTALAPWYAEAGLPAPAVPTRLGESQQEQMQVLLEENIAFFSFTFGCPDADMLARFREKGIFMAGTATTVHEARDLETRGVDAIVAQGAEAGGHRGTYLTDDFAQALTGNFALIPQIADAVSIPVIAAGGIADRRGVRAAFALGADAVSVGTAFLTTTESPVSAAYKQVLLSQPDTRLTRVFSGRPARGIPNRFMDGMSKFESSTPPYPVAHVLTQPLRGHGRQNGKTEYQSLWSGQAAGLNRAWSVAELVQELAAGLSR